MLRIPIAEQIRLNAAAFSTRPAIEVIGGPSLTFAEVWRRVVGLARALADVPEHEGRRMVGLLFPNGADAVLSLVACQLAGCTAVPINNRLAPPEMDYIVQDSGLVTVLATEPYLEAAAGLTGRAPVRVIDTATLRPAEDGGHERVIVDGSAPMLVGYTSGTTGFPKGALYSNDCMLVQYMRWGWQFGLTQRHTLLTAGPMFHNSYGGLSVVALLVGATNRVMTSFDPAVACDEFTHRSTFSFLVPSMTTAVLQEWDARGRPEMGALRYLLSSGAPISEALLADAIAAFPNAVVAEGYGWSEGGWVTYEEKIPGELRPGCVGWPMIGTEVAVLRPDGTRCAPGESGEVAARNTIPFDGYLNKPEATAKALVDDMVVSGDIGVFDPDGRLRLIDRKADMIVTGGENVYSAEVERVLLSHPGIAEAAVVGRPDDRWGEAVVAVVVPGDARIEPEEVRSYCRQSLAGYKVPKVVEVRSELPRNSMGKVQKFLLRERPVADDSVAVG